MIPPITSAPSRSQTHPNLPQGKEQVTLPMNFSPLSFSPEGEMQVTPNCHRQVGAGYSELLKIGWCRLLRIVKDRLVQVKDRLVHVTLVDVSNVSFHRDFCAVLGTVLAHLG